MLSLPNHARHALFGVIALLAAAAPANAAYELYISDTLGSSVTINSATGCTKTGTASCIGTYFMDLGAPGSITSFAGIGTFAVNVVTGVTKPVAALPVAMDLGTVQVQNAKPGGKLVVQWSDQDFELPFGIVMDAGGVMTAPLGSSVLYEAFLDDTNSLPGLGTLIGSMTFGPGAFSQSIRSDVMAAQLPYTLTQRLTLTFAGKGSASGNFQLQHSPEPSSILLSAVAMLITGLLFRRRVNRVNG